jgi:hypothetical protein
MAGLRRCDPVSHARNLRVRFLRVLSLVRHPVGTFPGQESPKHFLRVGKLSPAGILAMQLI